MFLYEAFTKRQLASNTSQLKANYLPLFDPDVYITTEGVRNSRWRILWNGIGNIDYCVIVRKTDVMNAFIEENLLEQVENFAKSLPINLLNRTLAWAYLDETRNSYAIEKEAPTADKLNRFVELLKQAHKARTLNEEYLVTLQNATVTNNYVKAYSFRTDQNYLSSGQRGAIGVSYIPPPPNLANELMK